MFNLNKISKKQWVFGILAMTITIFACKKDEELPPNPYDSVDYGTTSPYIDSLNQNSITSIHRDIFLPKCANPGCHDGTFEPDYRTIQSSYSTMVYHRINKNNVEESFTFRVLPFNKEESVLYERITNCCFVNQDDRMPQDNIGVGLPDEDIARIGAWIDEGAKDFTGNTASYPNTEPSFTFFVAIDTLFATTYQDNRVDDIPYNPFILENNLELYVVPLIEDDSTSTANLLNPTLSFSYTADGFDNPDYQITATPIAIPGEGEFMLCRFNTSQFLTDTTVYMRFSCNDGDHPNDTQFPLNSSPEPYKTYWSFTVNP